MALAHLVVRVAHDGRAVDVGRHVPAEALVEQVVLRRAGQVLRAAHDVGYAHQVIVYDVGEVVGRQAVALDQHLVVEVGVRRGDVAEDLVVEGGGALLGYALAYDKALARGGARVALLPAQAAAGVGGLFKAALALLVLGVGAEAAVGVSALHEQLGVLHVEPAPLGLDVGADRAADVGTLVVAEAALGQRAVDDVHRALDQAPLVGVLDAQYELALVSAGDQVGVQRGAQVADVHVSRGAGREACAHLAARYARLHIFKPFCVLQCYPSRQSIAFWLPLYYILGTALSSSIAFGAHMC